LAFISLALCAVEPVFSAKAEKTVSFSSFTAGNVILLRNGREYLFLHPNDMPKGGIVLQNSDVIQTSADAFVELRVKPGGISVRVAENSSLLVENITNAGNILVFSLIYGRIRIVQKRKADTAIVKVGLSLVEIRKGDVSIDYTVFPKINYKSPVISVSTLSGTADFIPSVELPYKENVKLKKKETFILYASEGRFERWVLVKDIVEYWKKKRKKA
jgi:hypothetical protein